MSTSQDLFDRALSCIPGGVNSPVRAFTAVGGIPRFVSHASGALITDVDGREYIDYVGSWGPMILGHSHPAVVEAVTRQAQRGASFGAPTELEVELAECITRQLPSMQRVRMVNSGTEATMSAIRLARGYTGRDTIVKFAGCYHGHADHLLVAAGSGALTLGTPSSPGVPASFAAHTLTLPYNRLEAVEELFSARGNEIAALIVEPIAGNMNCITPVDGFLDGLRSICSQHGSLLIFDEVMTGFRVHPGGAQTLYEVQPDLTTLGKIVGGGLPVGAFGGRADVMHRLAPEGPVYQAGTLSGNPLAMAAGLATLRALEVPGVYDRLNAATTRLTTGIAAAGADLPCSQRAVGSMFGLFPGMAVLPRDLDEASQVDTELFARWFHGMLDEGIWLAPSAFEAGFVSLAHSDEQIDRTIGAAQRVFSSLLD